MRQLRPLRRPLLAAVAALALVAPAAAAQAEGAPRAVAAAAVDPALDQTGPQPVRVVVQEVPGTGSGPEEAVERLGGLVTRPLPIVDGFAATLPAGAVRDLASTPGVRVVSADRQVQVQAVPTAAPAATAPVHLREIGSDKLQKAGTTGRGVTVAVLDTGIADVADLAGRIVPVRDELGRTASCQNLSGEPGCADSYGHGTFIAGLVAGNGSASGGRYVGSAPEARVLSVKVAGRSGAADVSTVLAGIQWVVSFREQYGIRVLNLSLGTDSKQSYKQDPLNYAVQRAWHEGIAVVVSAANLGPAAGTISKPGDDPWVITVGAVDDLKTATTSDDRLPDFSSRGPTQDGITKPDVTAPGAHLPSLRSPGSTIDTAFPAGTEGAYRRGSGTSMAAGVVSGAVAQLLQAKPKLTPNQVKATLRATARKVASNDANAVGTGIIDVAAAAAKAPTGTANTGLARSSGLGDLDASRGTVDVRLDDPLSTVLTGRQTAQLALWNAAEYTGLPWTPTTWAASPHALLGWNAASWSGHDWGGHDWGGSSWYGQAEQGTNYGRPTAGSAWYGAWD
ncbi:S8 family peptidase [Quadrisphaera sp. DSM 44207]|uniref:S8 family peptidase n=1 Tax=Quadrisphaera sp. DSM 44207 TaxID=1881057 RepID=UPI00088C6779|nr:S8 family peptidase [Quadrisphaera sp. DSM 44207]SDQ03951.1 serine protease AprX [Quadrisphaera sp. DSM 44207]